MAAGAPEIDNSSKRYNNLDLMRLIAAVLVIVSHSYPVVGLAEPPAVLDPTGLAWGHFGVLVFFSISGYLITASWMRDPQVISFTAKRAARILPGLVAALLVTAFLIGPVVTSVPLTNYFANLGTWLYTPNKAALFLPGWFNPPGLFENSPAPEINASLWTLPVEVACYLAVMLILLVRLGKPWVTGACTVVLAVLGNEAVLRSLPISYTPTIEFGGRILILVATFMGGATLFLLRDRLPLNIWIAMGAAAIAVASGFTPLGPTLAPILLPYVLLTIGLATAVVPLGKFRGWDLSYGTYVFAFPTQQAVAQISGSRSPWVITGLTLIIVLPLAALSWRFIEKPALLLPRRLPSTRKARETPLTVSRGS